MKANKRAFRIGSVVAVLILAATIAYRWPGPADRAPAPADDAAGGPAEVEAGGPAEVGGGGAAVATRADEASRAPIGPAPVPALPAETTDAVPNDAAPTEQELRALVEGIDPLLGQSNMIVRAPDPARGDPSLAEVESNFRTEGTDPEWSRRMESRILDQLSQIGDLSVVTLEVECRQSVCRVKLFHPPGTNALSSVDRLTPLATQLGFDRVVSAATLEQNGLSMSLLYLQRAGRSATP